MPSPLHENSDSDSPLSTLLGTPSPPDSPNNNTASSTIQIETSTYSTTPIISTPAKDEIATSTPARKVSAAKFDSSRSRAGSSALAPSITPVSKSSSAQYCTVSSSSSTLKTALSKLESTSSKDVNDTPSDITSSDEGSEEDAFFPNISNSSFANSTSDSATVVTSFSPAPIAANGYNLSRRGAGEISPSVSLKRTDDKKSGLDTFNQDVIVSTEKEKATIQELRSKRAQTQSKKAKEDASEKGYAEAMKTRATRKKNSSSPASSAKTKIPFTSGGIAAAAAAEAKAARDASNKEEVNEMLFKKQRGRPRKHPLPEKKESVVVKPVETTTRVVESIGRHAKRKLDLSIDTNDWATEQPTKSQDNISTTVNGQASKPSIPLKNSSSSSAKKARTTPPKVPKGLIEATRKSIRAQKLSPKAREALGVHAPPEEDDSVAMNWGHQEDGSWKEPKVLTKADHEREKNERELAKRNSKGTGVKSSSRVMSVRQWKEKFGANLPEMDYGKPKEYVKDLHRSELMKNLKSYEEELPEVAEFYKNEMFVTHIHTSGAFYNWHSKDLHHVEAPESNVRTSMREPDWKRLKYENELVGRLDNYSAPFKHFWAVPETVGTSKVQDE